MPTYPAIPKSRKIWLVLTTTLVSLLLWDGQGLLDVHAQGLYGLTDPYSPVVAVPFYQGEMRFTTMFVGVDSGKNSLPNAGESWSLRSGFNMNRNRFVLDFMARFQVGPVSLRLNGEQRDFVGVSTYKGLAWTPKAEARLEFSGYRAGVDLDLWRRCGSRAGLDFDYYPYRPVFSESIRADSPGKKLVGETAMTVGIHGIYTFARPVFGAWPVLEARIRWPIRNDRSTEITDLELAAGLRGAGTCLGSLAVRVGYRSTWLSFRDSQTYNSLPTYSDLEANLVGWFGELAYYY